MWQFTNKGQNMVSGITDDDEVDLNYDYVNYPPIIKKIISMVISIINRFYLIYYY